MCWPLAREQCQISVQQKTPMRGFMIRGFRQRQRSSRVLGDSSFLVTLLDQLPVISLLVEKESNDIWIKYRGPSAAGKTLLRLSSSIPLFTSTPQQVAASSSNLASNVKARTATYQDLNYQIRRPQTLIGSLFLSGHDGRSSSVG